LTATPSALEPRASNWRRERPTNSPSPSGRRGRIRLASPTRPTPRRGGPAPWPSSTNRPCLCGASPGLSAPQPPGAARGKHANSASRGGPLERSIARLATALLAGFLVVAAGLGYWQVLEAGALESRPNTPRLAEEEARVVRGRILDRQGAVLADNAQGPDGSRREY